MKKAAGGVLIACALGLIVALCLQASGAIVVFTNRDAWTRANRGGVDFSQDFNAFNFQLSADVPKDIAFPGFSVVQESGFAYNFAGSAELFASDATPLFLAFNNSVLGFGAEFEILEGTLQLETLGGRGEPLLFPRTGFFGILSDQPFNAINFSAALSRTDPEFPVVHFRLDNVSLAQAVPEPASLILFGAGFSTAAGYVAVRRRWRRRCAAA